MKKIGIFSSNQHGWAKFFQVKAATDSVDFEA